MSNSFKVVDRVAKEALRIAHEKLTFIGTVDRQYDESFKYDGRGGPNGQTLRVRSPNMYTRRQGSRVMDVQDQNEVTQTITVATQDGVDMRFNSTELVQSVNSDGAFDNLSKNYIEPAISSLVSGIESDFLAYTTKRTYNHVGTAGTVVGTNGDISALYQARGRLNQMLAPKDGNRFVQMDSVTMGTVANGIKTLFHEGSQVTEAFREGFITKNAMATYYENERVWTMSNGADLDGTTDVAAGVTDGGNTLSADTAAAVTYTVGQVFTLAGIYACHPETKASLGYLQPYTNLSGTGSGGDMTVSPPFYLTGPRQNVCSASGAQLSPSDFNSKALTEYGAASTSYVQNLMYHKDAFQFITADLPLMDDAHKCVRMTKDGISLRVWQASDIRNDELLLRIDVLYGFKTLRPAWACRISN